MSSDLTLFFIAEPPEYQYMACHLAASARLHLPSDVELVAYCPAHKLDAIDPATLEVMRRLRCEVRGFEATGRFGPAYPHGNKLLAALEPRATRYSAFMDSDMLFIADTNPADLLAQGQIGVVPSTSMRWAPQTIWDDLYGLFEMPPPQERIEFTRDKRQKALPYFNAGLVVIDEAHRNAEGLSFSETWMETAQRIDACPTIDNKRPYLDQMSLPIAIQRAQMAWNILPETFNFSIGGILRGKPIAPELGVKVLHYRRWKILEESGFRDHARHALAKRAGTRRVNWVFLAPPPAGVTALPEGVQAQAAPARPNARADRFAPAIHQDAPPKPEAQAAPATVPAPAGTPDPSKAAIALVAPWAKGQGAMAKLWLEYWVQAIGAENIHLLGDAPLPPKIKGAKAINRIPLPQGTEIARDNDALWQGLSHYASGLTLYYNWVITLWPCEIILPDPALGLDLRASLDRHFLREAPLVLAPFGAELALPARAGGLGQGAGLRLRSDLCKPAISRVRILYSAAGQASSRQKTRLDDRLWLLQLTEVETPVTPAPDWPDLAQLAHDLTTTRRAVETAQGKFWFLGAPAMGADWLALPDPWQAWLAANGTGAA